MKKSEIYYILIFLILGLGVVTYLVNSEILNISYIILVSTVLLSMTVIMMIFPLFKWLFYTSGIKYYKIKKGKRFSSLLPIFKPYFKEKEFSVSINIILKDYDLKFHSDQVNKLFGYNKGIPGIDNKTLKLIHLNSKRLGFRIKGDTIEFVMYERIKGNIIPSTVLDRVKLRQTMGVYETGYVDLKITRKGFGYMLPRPYFGGNSKSPVDINFKYIVF